MARGGSGVSGAGGSGGSVEAVLPNPGVSVEKVKNLPLETEELYVLERDIANYCDDPDFLPTSRVVIKAKEDGVYEPGAMIAWSPEDADIRLCYMRKVGGARISTDIIGTWDAVNNATQWTSAQIFLNAGQEIEFLLVETSGSPLIAVFQDDFTATPTQGGWGRFWLQRIDQGTPNVGCTVRRTSNQSIPPNAFTAVIWQEAPRNVGGIWVSGADLIVLVTGRYNIGFKDDWAPNGVSVRYGLLVLNDVVPIFNDINSRDPADTASCTANNDGYTDLYAGDKLTLYVFQVSDGPPPTTSLDLVNPELWIELVRQPGVTGIVSMPGASVGRSSDQVIPDDGNEHLVSFNVVNRDSGAFFSLVTPTEFTITSDGGYKLNFSVFFGGSNLGVGPGQKFARLKYLPVGGGPEVELLKDVRGLTPDPTTLHGGRPYEFVTGDKIRLYVKQETGADINILNTDVGGVYQPISPVLSIQKLYDN